MDRNSNKTCPAKKGKKDDIKKIVDIDKAISYLDGNTELFEIIAKNYISDSQIKKDALRTALEENNIKEINRLAHSIKGTAKYFFSEKLVNLASGLENKAKNGEIKDYSEDVNAVCSELDRLKDALLSANKQ